MLAANQAAVNTVQQLAKMHQKLEMQQLEKIRDICEAALEDMDSLPDKVDKNAIMAAQRLIALRTLTLTQGPTERERVARTCVVGAQETPSMVASTRRRGHANSWHTPPSPRASYPPIDFDAPDPVHEAAAGRQVRRVHGVRHPDGAGGDREGGP